MGLIESFVFIAIVIIAWEYISAIFKAISDSIDDLILPKN